MLAAIPDGGAASLERDVFPKVIRKGLHGFRFSGYWSDVGTRENLIRATEILLRAQGSEVNRRAKVLPSARLTKPVAVAADATVDGDVGPVAVIGNGCVLTGARISRSVLFDRASVGDGATVTGSILGEGSIVGPRALVRDSIVGDGAGVEPGKEVGGGGGEG